MMREQQNEALRKACGRIRSAVALGHDPETFIRELEDLLGVVGIVPRGYELTPEKVRDLLAIDEELAA
jgi:hypothetical protein